MKNFHAWVLPVLLAVGQTLHAQVRITEFMASNTQTLADEDGDYSDWIELQNTTTNPVSLLNWSLTDSAGNPGKWRFPATNLPPKSFLIVFASGKNRATNGAPLHTSFKLGADGEYLGLFDPEGTAATEIAPKFPQQFPDVSYGLGMLSSSTTLVATNAAMRFVIPANSAQDATWTALNFDDSAWRAGVNGIGYDTGLADPQEESFSAKLLATGPIAYWRLNETNSTTAANSGSGGVGDVAGYRGGLVLGQPGPQPPSFPTFETNNTSPLFDGWSGYIGGPYQFVNNLPAFTIGGWIYPTATPNSRTGLFGQNDTIEFGFSDASQIQIWSPAGSVTVNYPFHLNTWHHVMAVGGNGQLSVYLDGINAGSTSVSAANFGESDYSFNIGGGGVFDPSGNFFQGRIDEVGVWYRALAANEITALFATNAMQVNYSNYFATDVRSLMFGSNATAYVRIPFTLAPSNNFDSMQLRMRFDDGFAAFLNGHLIVGSNAPATLAWNSSATQRQLDPQAVQWTVFDVSAARQWLQPGANVLAIQALNFAASNVDFLMQAQLVGTQISDTAAGWRYFVGATPGAPNGTSTNDFGPILSAATHSPNVPSPGGAVVVSARTLPGFSPIANVTLHYRSMFNTETNLLMSLADTNGLWTATIPGGAAAAGQLLRYYVTATDVSNNVSRWPFFSNATDSQQYLGTVVADPSVKSQLPVACLFIQDTTSADNRTGTQAALFYQNELYDNINIYVHGQSSVGWPKKSHNIGFTKDHQFLCQGSASREKKVIFLSNYGDKARMHTTLTYAATALSGGMSLFSFPIRVQLNGVFFGIEDMVEHGDDSWLNRISRDGNGALYKMYDAMDNAGGNEKKTRDWEGPDDLTALITNLDESLPLATRVQYAWDNLDLPQTANYFAAMALVSSQDVGKKNYYLYRDSDGNGEWGITPWDVDLTWGRNWLDSDGYFTDTLFTTNTLVFYNQNQQANLPTNRLFSVFFAQPEFRQMYLRRLRTLMDTILMPAGTPTNALVIEPLVRQLENAMNPASISPSDAALDYAAWGPWWGDSSLSQVPSDAERLISIYLPGRRSFLYSSKATLFGDLIPAAQPTNTVITLGAWDYNPASGNLSEQYVELRNTNAWPVDVSGWRLLGTIEFTLQPGTVIPAGKSLYLAANVNAFRARAASPHAGQNCFVQGPFGGFLSTKGNSSLILENSQHVLVTQNSYAGSATATQFVAGNLAVLRAGDGSEALGSHGDSVFIDQFTTTGTLVNSLAVPDNATNSLIISGSASSEGALTRSLDGRLLVCGGYRVALTNTAGLAASLANSDAVTVPRALGVLDGNGGFALAGVTTNQYGGNNLRSGASDGLGNYWGAGATSGTYYFGDSTANTVQSNVVNSAVIQAIGGNLYFSTSKATPGIWRITGLPVVSNGTSLFFTTGPKASPFGFAFNSNNTVAYVADDTLKGVGGVQRWNYSGGAWSLAYAFTSLTNTGARGLAVDFSGALPVIYATTAGDTTNRLVSLTDTGASASVTTLATAGVNQVFRGLAWAPGAAAIPAGYASHAGTNGFSMAWTALLNRNYTVQYTARLADSNWVTLTNVTTTSPVLRLNDPAPASSNRFYRAILNP